MTEQTSKTTTGYVAFGFGPDDMAYVAGDSFYSVAAESAIEVEQDATFDDIAEVWYEKMAREWMGEGECVAQFIDEYLDQESLSGFWVVEDKILVQLDQYWSAMDPRNDSQTYATNRAAKLMVRVQARVVLPD